MKKIFIISLFITALCFSGKSFAADYYWVGGTGNWSEFGTHWATTSGGGVFHASEPTLNDNVYFDANSFSSAGEIVTVDVMAYCKTIDWTGVTNTPDFSGSNTLEIYGSLIFSPNMTSTYNSNILFTSNDLGNTINFSTIPLSISGVEFNGNGDWTYQSDMDLSLMGGGITVSKGTVNTNDYTISIGWFDSWDNNNRTINLGNSVLNITWNLNLWNTSTLNFNTGTSTINYGSNWFDGMGLTYYNFKFTSTSPNEITIMGSNTFHTLDLSDTNVIGVNFAVGEVNTIYNIYFGGTCANRKTIKSDIDGETTTIKKLTGTITEDYLNIRDITVIGGATFITNNGVNMGNVVNWTINPSTPTDYYWVGGTGNWSDADHWSAVSGGAYPSGGSCVPSSEDNVYFDANSFSASGEVITVDVPAICKSMNWTGVTNNPDLTTNWPGAYYIYGSLTFDSGMTLSGWGDLYFMANNTGNTINSAGIALNYTIHFSGSGDWTLTDNLNFNSIYLNQGHLITNNNTLNGYNIHSNSGLNRQLDLGSSVINLSSTWSISNNSNMIINSGTSTINLSGYDFYGGDFTYNDLNITSLSNITIYNSNTFNTITIGSSVLNLEEGQTQIVNDLIVSGTCGDIINIKSNSAGNTSSISKASGTVNIDYIALQDIAAIGGATFNANNSIDIGNNTGWNFSILPSTDYYWIGGTGSWNDPNNWSLSSGGVANPGGCLPTQVDNVFFDGNSGLSYQTVEINDVAYCNNMDWTGATNSYISGTYTLNIHGSLTCISSMNINYYGTLSFKSDNIGNTIDFAGNAVRGTIYFDGSGEWTLLNDITKIPSNNSNIHFYEGSLITNDFNITTHTFYTNTEEIRQLNLGNSIITANYWHIRNGTNLTITPMTSTLNVSSVTFYGGNQNYNDVNLSNSGDITIYGENSYNNLNIPSSIRIQFEEEKTQTVNNLIISSGSDCNNYIHIGTTSTGAVAHLSMPAGVFNGDWLAITDLTASGGGTFNATNSQGVGNVTGWNITSTAPVDLYWIGNGGDWDDPLHWALTSGGSSYGCIPASIDNVFFDANSFSSPSQVVNINTIVYCKNMDWTGVTNIPDVQGWNSININGSLTLVPEMAFTYWGIINLNSDELGNTITSGGQNIYGIQFSGSGEYTLLDNLSLGWSGLVFNNGTLNTNNFNLNIPDGGLISNSSSTRTLNLGSSIINISFLDIINNTNLTINAGTSEISTSLNSWMFNGGDMTYYNVTLLNPSWGGVELRGSNTFNTLTINPGAEIIFEEGTTQTTTDFQATGTDGQFVHIHTTTTGTQAFINQTSHEFCSDYMKIQDINVGTETFYAGNNSVDLGNNVGWTWSGVTAINQYPAALCEDSPGSGTHAGIDLTLLENTIDGGNGYLHTWYIDPDLTTPVVNPLSVSVSDGQIFYDEVNNGICTNIAEVIYSVTSPVLSFNVTDVLLCNGDMTGAIDLTVTGATLPITYEWSNSDLTEDLLGVVAGSYTVTVTDANSCTISGGEIINQPLAISIDSETYTDITCNNDNDGTITVIASGGTGALSYDIGTGAQATGVFSGLTAGTYTVTITDINMCSETSTPFVIVNPSVVSIDSEAHTDIICHDDNDGTITVTASGGTGALSFDIGAGSQGSGNFSGLAAGTYIVTVSDINMCSQTSSSFVIDNPLAIDITESHTDVSICGGADGSIDITATGGTGTLYYAWTGPAAFSSSLDDISNLVAGSYTLVVSDDNSCSNTINVSISEVGAPTISLDDQTNVLCYGECTGDATVSATGGQTPYSYTWSNGDTGPVASNLCAGLHSVTLTDANSCSTIISVTITEPLELTASNVLTHETCYSACDGSATITASGGTGALDYDIGTGIQPTGDFFSLCAGAYTYTVTDINGCEYIDNFSILPYDMDGTISGTHPLCHGDCNGDATILASAGSGTYSYVWNTLETTPSISNLCDGLYSVTITDIGTGCTLEKSINIIEPELLSLSLSSTMDSGTADGTATVVSSGGTPPYNYSWNDPATQTTPIATGLSAGNWTVTVTDNNGCTETGTTTVDLYSTLNNNTIISQVKLFPNPSSGLLNLDIKNYPDVELSISIYTVNGQIVYSNQYKLVDGALVKTIDLSNLSSGMYYLRIISNNLNTTEKIVLEDK
ncbi:MAG: T9SS type A sorting domain-containing protein [Bacteroidales bacterium]|nr:T9SS type A sorting domain-containing protein [Bacteroidales bacterium]